MSDRDRSEFTALVAVACTVVVFVIGLVAGGYNYERYEQQAAQSYGPGLHLLEGSPEGYQAICNAPKSETQADLCQQWRAAEAATNAAGWTQAQTWIGVAGLAGLIATVFYARRAFRQTVVQAKAAIAANEIANKSAERQLRAYLTIDRMEGNLSIGSPIETTVWFRNSGVTPAYDVRVIISGIWTRDRHEKFWFERSAWDSRTDVGGGQEKSINVETDFPLTPAEVSELRREKRFWLVGGIIQYKDCFGIRRRTVFRSFLRVDDLLRPRMVAYHRNNRGS